MNSLAALAIAAGFTDATQAPTFRRYGRIAQRIEQPDSTRSVESSNLSASANLKKGSN